MTTYDSVILGKYIVALAHSKRVVLNMTKLQKLMFMLYGYYKAVRNHQITGERPQAWPFGPVFARVHKNVDYTAPLPLSDPCFITLEADDDLKLALNLIIDKYAKYTASQLSGWSHMQGSPWERTTKSKDFNWSREIPDDYISEYFSSKAIVC